ncbi:hypothetical protein Tco_0918763, partial [Tanacetum coccineum]
CAIGQRAEDDTDHYDDKKFDLVGPLMIMVAYFISDWMIVLVEEVLDHFIYAFVPSHLWKLLLSSRKKSKICNKRLEQRDLNRS